MKMKNIYLLLGLLLFITACNNDLDQVPPNIASADSLTDFDGVLNAAYFYQLGTVTPVAIMGDFRADNAFMFEEPFPAFDRFTSDFTDMEDQFFGPFYTAAYRCILSANNVIENSTNATHIGEAQFLRALTYFKLVRIFGDVPVNLAANPSITDTAILARQPVADIYDNVIIPDLTAAIAALDIEISEGRASRLAAQGLLGKVYVNRGDFVNAEPHLAAVVNGAAAAGISLQDNFEDIFGDGTDLNSEILYATQITSSVADEYGFTEFAGWYSGGDTKSLNPLDSDLIDAFDAVAGEVLAGGTDLRRAVTINEALGNSTKWGGAEQDWIELRLADIILLYAETLNENGSTPDTVLALIDPIRTRAGLNVLDPVTISTQALVRQAIQDERRLELAFEGQRWFDLARTGTAEAELGTTINSNFLVAPIPISEILATNGVITQNPGY